MSLTNQFRVSNEKQIENNRCRISLHRSFIHQCKERIKEHKSFKKQIELEELFIDAYKQTIKELKEEIKELSDN